MAIPPGGKRSSDPVSVSGLCSGNVEASRSIGHCPSKVFWMTRKTAGLKAKAALAR